MLPELRYELLFFYTRDQLEHLQPLSQSLLDIIVAGSKVLPLRPIVSVHMGWKDAGMDNSDKIEIVVDDGRRTYYEASIRNGGFKETFLRLQNTCIKFFHVRIRDSPFLRYWMAQETAAFTVVRINCELRKTRSYDLLDSIVNHLRPRTTHFGVRESSWHENGYNREKLKLLARASFLNSLKTCSLIVDGDAFPPSSFILNEPGYPSYELDLFYDSDAADGIDGLIESFVRDGCSNEKLESVCIHWCEREDQPSPAPKKLSKPTKVDVPLPKNDLTSSFTSFVHRVTKCERHSFVNTKQWKHMEVHKWIVEDVNRPRPWITHVLQCLVKNF